MNTTRVLFLCFLLSMGCATKNNETVVEIATFEEIDSLMNRQIIAWNQGSIDGFMEGYWNSDSLSFITRNGKRNGWDEVTKMYKKSYDTKQKMGVLSFEILERKFLDKNYQIANVYGMYRVDKTMGDSAHRDSGYFSLIFNRFPKSGWKIVMDHTF